MPTQASKSTIYSTTDSAHHCTTRPGPPKSRQNASREISPDSRRCTVKRGCGTGTKRSCAYRGSHTGHYSC
ncbi:hypothetical protein CY34DRAFT_808876 [Suillus luteus UH-Slu-Lm8-n1]|uniref:Uncharacterized protein n=1 Tax=Suillus luteus UH-Slu-Lm8-n1 TaxID=930992 RepID=A0A0D0B4V7_9AGAM|nr:hypothetical protein CY34DRAFT_808876 [Suillus luteus UH-Slu-Lm8-n1]